MKGIAAAALAAALTAAGCATGSKEGPTRTLVVEGWAPLQTSERASARRQALADAQRRAVEEGAGVEIASISLIDDAAMLRQRLSSTARGTIRRFKVLGEKVENGMLKVRARVEVSPEPANGARRLGWAPGTGPKAALEPGSAPAEAFTRAWTRHGGEVAGSPEEADLILKTSVETLLVPEPRLKPFVSVRARFRLSASPAPAGGSQWAVVREAAALGLDERDARTRALELAAAAAAEAAARELPSRLWLQARVAGRR